MYAGKKEGPPRRRHDGNSEKQFSPRADDIDGLVLVKVNCWHHNNVADAGDYIAITIRFPQDCLAPTVLTNFITQRAVASSRMSRRILGPAVRPGAELVSTPTPWTHDPKAVGSVHTVEHNLLRSDHEGLLNNKAATISTRAASATRPSLRGLV